MKKSAQFGFIHIGLIVGLIILGIIGYYVYQNSQLKQQANASTQATFSNLSAILKANSATFNFGFWQKTNTSTSFIISVSTDSNMRKDVFSPFGTGSAGPIVVSAPQQWSKYQCGLTVYWKVNATVLKGSPIASSIQKAVVDCSAPSPAPVGIGSTAPYTTNVTTTSGTDGTWCVDYDGKSAVNFLTTEPNISITTQSFCQDNSGIHTDACETGTNIADEYYCNLYRYGDGTSSTRCEPRRSDCSPSILGWDTCTRGACTISNPPSAQVASSNPPAYTLKGADNTWCYATNPNVDLPDKGTCQDQRGLYTDYCSNSNNNSIIEKYYCTGDWDGSVYNNVRCEIEPAFICSGTYSLDSSKQLTCSDGTCRLL